ncbi:Acyl-CoA synthetase (AMP-forming)/AMP-acid ligase II [Actinokineospora alba]|uniref:Acyl-CoA synthetase (AMP-forming)/AMP-acid ligase II n=1 Tax=Actinokineospora alba TaxID=504798 RepID=A0A1H0FVM5_9PSEU|nr:fatty acyl-AMP ligase [Actinokineospora alba]TDP69641.1 acyl-CoA synthetase (AMP-forming)/AMP-acid ligase II [Actinokineospora alba]SDI12289.1 Acyl-CoA synthetase (AMP-forming)/AMP-acid ligase II [Actinokineospora alba]SDN98717.1 Acyl-CoA synthetase (AMP-forming)/AMP-acid ligase II [Actinokineospora alba]
MVDLQNASSVAAVIRDHVRAAPDDLAVIVVPDVDADDDTRWTYARLDAEARKVGAWLRARYPVGERLLLLYPTGVDFVAALVGCLYAGMAAVPAPLPGRYREERSRVQGIAENAGVCAILTDSENLAAVADWADAEGLTTPVVATDGVDLPDPGAWQPQELDRSALAMLQYTSGTTGAPKGAMLSHGNLLHNVENQRVMCRLTRETRLGGWLPLYHDMGLLGQLVPALLVGTCCVLMRPASFLKRPHQWLRLIDKYGIHSSAGPSFAYDLVRDRITDDQLAELDLSRWRFSAIGAEPVRPATLDGFIERFAPAGLREDVLTTCYGMAEATVYVSGDAFRPPKVTTVDSELLEQQRFVAADGADGGVGMVSCGTPHTFDVVIIDPTTAEPLPPGSIGEICLRGGSLATGYWNDNTANAFAWTTDGYLRTGDLGTVHDGEVYVTGRCVELVTVAGRKFSPQDIERTLRARHPELGSVGAVFSVPLGEADAATDALIVTHEISGRPTADRLRVLAEQIRATVVGEFGVPVDGIGLLRRAVVRRTTSGKIQRATMRRMLLADELTAVYADYEPWVVEALQARRREPAGV